MLPSCTPWLLSPERGQHRRRRRWSRTGRLVRRFRSISIHVATGSNSAFSDSIVMVGRMAAVLRGPGLELFQIELGKSRSPPRSSAAPSSRRPPIPGPAQGEPSRAHHGRRKEEDLDTRPKAVRATWLKACHGNGKACGRHQRLSTRPRSLRRRGLKGRSMD